MVKKTEKSKTDQYSDQNNQEFNETFQSKTLKSEITQSETSSLSETSTQDNLKKEHDYIKKEHESLKKEYDELKNSLQRIQAEFINYKKRTEEEKSRFVSLANEQLIKKILPIIDNLEHALQSATEKDQNSEFTNGINLIYAQFREFLYDEGLSPIIAAGMFNPKLHEAILTEETDKEPGTILEEIQKGYMLGDKILRHSKVKISKSKSNGGKQNEQSNRN